jgi:hypothetical protein
MPPPGQPLRHGIIGGFEIIGNSLVSAQQVCKVTVLLRCDRLNEILPQLFLGTADKVFFVDKVENNPTKIKDHPAWASGTFEWFDPCVWYANNSQNGHWPQRLSGRWTR